MLHDNGDPVRLMCGANDRQMIEMMMQPYRMEYPSDHLRRNTWEALHFPEHVKTEIDHQKGTTWPLSVLQRALFWKSARKTWKEKSDRGRRCSPSGGYFRTSAARLLVRGCIS